jgi:L-fuconolactonase
MPLCVIAHWEGFVMHRRDFLASLAVTGGALAARSAEEAMFPIVDTHQHLWDLEAFRLPWIEKGSALDRNYLMADYRKATARLGTFTLGGKKVPARLTRAIYMEVDVAPDEQLAEAEHVIELCKRGGTPTVAAVVSGRPVSAQFGRYLDRFKGSPYIKGVRQVLHVPSTPKGYCLQKEFIRGVRLLGARGLSFDLCMRPEELVDAARLIDACPDTRFILDHCGNANVQAKDRSRWQKGIAEVAKRKNVVCKVSGIVVTAKPGKWEAGDLAPIVRHTREVFGPDRVMFGGDWPVCTKTATFARWVAALRDIVADRPEDEQRKLFHDNAVRFYGIE